MTYTERELKEIELARHYMQQMGAYGTDGHTRLVLVAKLADHLYTVTQQRDTLKGKLLALIDPLVLEAQAGSIEQYLVMHIRELIDQDTHVNI